MPTDERRTPSPSNAVLDATLYAQAGYFIVTGAWPFISMRSFEFVSGPKTDRWLVKTVGALVTVIGATLLAGRRRGGVSRETAVLGAGAALVLTPIEAWYAVRRRISLIYLLDALVELGFFTGWVAGLWAQRREE